MRAALASGQTIPHDQLLLVRDLSGKLQRQLEPPEGVVPRPGAVLLLLYADGDELHLPLTVRSEHLPHHRGEVSLPGGATDAEDDGPVDTALRECYEEIGVARESIEVWGMLSPLYIRPSNFQITPVVGFSPQPPELRLNAAEVSMALTISLSELLDPARVMVEQWTLRGSDVQVPFFSISGYKVWGATALILSELVARMRQASQIALP